MARTKNLVETVPVTVALTPQIYKLLEALTRTGYAGKNAAATAEEMIRRGLESSLGGKPMERAVQQQLASFNGNRRLPKQRRAR